MLLAVKAEIRYCTKTKTSETVKAELNQWTSSRSPVECAVSLANHLEAVAYTFCSLRTHQCYWTSVCCQRTLLIVLWILNVFQFVFSFHRKQQQFSSKYDFVLMRLTLWSCALWVYLVMFCIEARKDPLARNRAFESRSSGDVCLDCFE